MKYQQPYGISDPNAPYINGNPSTGTMGSIPPAASIEHPQREIVGVISNAGLTPADTDLGQLAKAIQSGKLIYSDDTGTVNAIQLTPSPAVTALTKGMVFVTKAAVTNTGPTTVKVSALPPVPAVHASDQTPLNALDINANAMLAFAYDGANMQLVWSSRQPGSPVFLTGDRNFYVNGVTGLDTYDGTTATVTGGHGPFKTLQKAADQVPQYNLNGHDIYVNVADATYASVTHRKINGSGRVIWIGNTALPVNCLCSGSNKSAMILNDLGGEVQVTGFKLEASGSGGGDAICGINAYGATTALRLGNIEFGNCVGAQMSIQKDALVTNLAGGDTWKISGSCFGNQYEPGCFLFCYVGGTFINASAGGPNITIPVAVAYGGYGGVPGSFVHSVSNSFVQLVYASMTGAGVAGVTGKRYTADYNSAISTGAGGASYYPGNQPGTAVNGGYYT